MPGTDKYGQGIPYSLLTDAPDAEILGKGIADAVAARCVMRFESAANWGATLTGASPVAEGMVTYLKDANRLEYHDGAAWRSLTPGPWIPLPLAPGIVSNSGSPAYRLADRSVEIRGTVARTGDARFNTAGATLLATLPAGYRPSYWSYKIVATEWVTGITGRLELNPTGDLTMLIVGGGTGPTWVGVDAAYSLA